MARHADRLEVGDDPTRRCCIPPREPQAMEGQSTRKKARVVCSLALLKSERMDASSFFRDTP